MLVRVLGFVCAAVILAGCSRVVTSEDALHVVLPAVQPAAAVGAGWDWTVTRYGSPSLARERAARFRALALGDPAPNWISGGQAGLSLATLGLDPADGMPNGPAVAYRTDAGSPLVNQIFFLSARGRLLRVDRNLGTTTGKLDLGKACTHTSVALSPGSARAYILSDDGTLDVVNTAAMSVVATRAVGPARGISPWIDPYVSDHADHQETVYIATNAGSVVELVVTGNPDGSVSGVKDAGHFDVATGVTPLNGGRDKLTASPVVLGGQLVIGDQAGWLHVWDTAPGGKRQQFDLGAPISTPPAIEIQDGSYHPVDAAGQAVKVPEDNPIYAFVTAGPACAWVDLAEGTVTWSPPLRVDDHEADRTFGFLADYHTAAAGQDDLLRARDAVNTWPGSTRTAAASGWIAPAQGTPGSPDTGPTRAYLRWAAAAAWPAGTMFTHAELGLTSLDNAVSLAPTPYGAATSVADGAHPWEGNALVGVNLPATGRSPVGAYAGGAGPDGRVTFRAGASYPFDVTAAFPFPTARGFALALAAGGPSTWPAGPGAVRFAGNAAPGADPALVEAGDLRPALALTPAVVHLDGDLPGAAPLVDSLNHMVYVQGGNVLYAFSYASTAAFMDRDTDPATGARVPHAVFDRVAGPNGTRAPSTYAAGTKLLANPTEPAIAFDGSALTVLARVPGGAAPDTWTYVLSRFSLPLAGDHTQLQAGARAEADVAGTGAASAFMVIDPYDGAATGGDVYFGLPNGRIYRAQKP